MISTDEYVPELRGRQLMRTIEEMRRGDATIQAGLKAVKYPIVAAEWYADPGGDEKDDQVAAELIEHNFREILNWEHTLQEILTMLDFGFSVFEIVLDTRVVDGVERIVVTKLAYRKQTTIEAWQTEDKKPGITQRRSDGSAVSIPLEKLMVFTHQQEGDNWEGISILRSSYQDWYFKKTLTKIEAIGHERQALGVLKIKYPKGASKELRNQAAQAAQNVRANERAYIEEPDGWDIDFMDMKANTTKDPREAIAYHDRQILKNMSVQYIDIGSQGTSGSFSASTDQRKLLELQDQAIAKQIAAKINETVVKLICDLNFNLSTYPKWTVGKIGDENVVELSDAIAKFTTAKLLTPNDQDEEHVRKLLRFPAMPEGEEVDRTVKEEVKDKDVADDVEDESEEAKKVEANRRRNIQASVSARDFPDLYDGIDIDPNDLGCIMLDTETLDVLKHIPEDLHSDLVEATTRHDHTMGAVAETEAHVTLLYGLLENGNVWKDKVDTVLKDWKIDTVKIAEVGFFDTSDSYAVIAHIETTPELIDGHERLTLLPHIQTFSEYKPHLTLAYVSKDADVDKWVDVLGKAYNGRTVKAKSINYGDLPKKDDKKVEASVLAHAREIKNALAGELYGTAGFDTSHVA
ncbi:hypothetical protein Z045_05760 [Rhodococcus pyridinivorans KG-16]|uniref:Uncharacterized protein n=1 Tax=Rhodococcus pyridinivorans KG-16 TaxID=1441730 RepID=A0A0V9UNV2_9NOCA|nr:DUF935 family protein [Rhodococcus pyridinivorans]KSZ59674.1 hypothetical protein Z045_05760 [Rhodococcus pyridinivorans KG-16]